MRRIRIWNDKPSAQQLNQVAKCLEKGDIAIMPTDTMYAIVCDALNIKAIDRLCNIKGLEPGKHPLSIICSDISMASEYARINDASYGLMKANTPGPFTFLLPASSNLPKAFKGRKTVGIRIPDNNFARQLTEYYRRPLLTTSIGYEDVDYAVNTDLIAETYDHLADLMIEGEAGSTDQSTIVDCIEYPATIIRQGIGNLN